MPERDVSRLLYRSGLGGNLYPSLWTRHLADYGPEQARTFRSRELMNGVVLGCALRTGTARQRVTQEKTVAAVSIQLMLQKPARLPGGGAWEYG